MAAGAHAYRREPADAAALVRGVVEDFRRELAAQGFTIDCWIDQDSEIEADTPALACALWNLLDNAVKYSGAGREIAVRLSRADGMTSISVRDRGIGIPGAQQLQVFDKFVRGDEARTRGIKGTGIGLSMVRHIVEGHGGRVRLDSQPGEGSTFTLLIPGRM